VPRNRASTARLAVLGSSVQRSAPASYPSRATTALRRRVVMGVLVLVSLTLITVYFRESPGGALHQGQSAGVTVLRPFEVGAERVVRPFRDLYGWFASLVHARSENKRLQIEVDRLRQLYVASESALYENARLRALLHYKDTAAYPKDYKPVNARVISRPPSQFDQQVVISAGSQDGVHLHDPVVTADGLVGEVTKVVARAAQVTLLTDQESAVAAIDLTGASGLIRHGHGTGSSLILDRVTKDQVVRTDDVILTAGTIAGGLASLYPKGIPIGIVTSVGQTDTDLYKQIQVAPFVDFSELDSVAVLVSKRPLPRLP
jgi:rod shape-determining protein MreC